MARPAAIVVLGSALGVALALAPARGRGQTPAGVTDLPALLAAAQQHSHDLKAARHNLQAAEAQLGEATVSPFFQFKTKAGFAVVPDAGGLPGYRADPIDQLDRDFGPALRATVEGAIPLWTFGKLGAARDAARAGVRAAELGEARSRARVVYDVRRAYYGLQLALDTRQMISEGLPKLEKALEQLDARIAEADPGEVDPLERYRLTSTLAEVRARSSEVDRLEASSRAALRVLTGLSSISVPECPLEPLPYAPEKPSSYGRLALQARPELGMLRAAASARQAEVDATRARYFPDLALGLELTTEYIPGRTVYEYYTPLIVGAALVARWELDFWGNSYRTRRAEAKLLETREQELLAADGVQVEVAARRAELADARRRVDAWAEGHRETRKWFLSAAQGYQIGTVTTKELVDGVGAYFKARFAHLSAIHDHNQALAALEQAVGKPLLPAEAWAQRCDLGD